MTATTAAKATTASAAVRTIHLVDLENLTAGPDVDGLVAASTLDTYLRLAHYEEGDLVYVAMSQHLAARALFHLPSHCTSYTGSGQDAADELLLEHAPEDFIVERCGRLVVGSGDGHYIQRALAVRSRGVGVAVVARPGSVNTGWRRHHIPVVDLSTDPDLITAA